MPTWSSIRKKLEQDYLCPPLRGHIQYFAATYSKSHDHEGQVFYGIRMKAEGLLPIEPPDSEEKNGAAIPAQ